jgi:hypothetical protein
MGSGNFNVPVSSFTELRCRLVVAAPRCDAFEATAAAAEAAASDFVDPGGRPRRFGGGGGEGSGGGENSLSSGKLLPLLPSSCCNSSGSHPLVGVSGWRQLMPATLSPPPPPPPPLPPPPPSFRPDPSSRRERAVEKLPKPSRGTCRVKRKMISAIRW